MTGHRIRRLGIVYPTTTPLSPRSWSGTPAGLASGFAELGIEIVPLGADLGLLGRAYRATGRWGQHNGAVADRLASVRAVRSRAMARTVRVAGALDAVLAMGTEMYDLATVVPSVIPRFTYDDATLRQMADHPHSDLRRNGLPGAHVEHWVGQQLRSARAATKCFTSTSWAAESLHHDYGIGWKQLCVVGIGHRPRRVSSEERDWSRPRFLFVGLDWDRKNGQAVVDAFAEIRREIPEATLDLVGTDRRLAASGVTVHGILPRDDPDAQARLDRLYAKATCFVLPSRFDPAGIAFLEAASAGLAVVTTTQGGAQELLGEGALTVDPDSHEQITEAMRRAADPGTAQRMGALASAGAARSTWTEVASRILNGMAPQSVVPTTRSTS